MTAPPFEYHPAAILEAHEAFHWYAERDEEVADRFWKKLVQARKMVSETPHRWTPYFHGTRVFRLRKFPYGLVYLEKSDLTYGIAVCHFSRRPGYWQDRL